MVGWLHVDGRWIKDSVGRVFRIAGAGDAIFSITPEDGVSPYIFPEKLDLFQRAGANTYRLGIALDTYDSPEYALLVNQMIQWCKERGLYVQLDAHAIAQGTGQGNPWLPIFGNPELLYQFWEARARQYLTEPTVAFFEICNEPMENRDLAEQWRVIATTCVRRIHAINPNVICVVGDVSWNSRLETFQDNPINEPNVVYTIHRYYHYSDWTDWGAAYLAATTETELQSAYILMKNFFYANGFDMLDKGYPVILGELGTWRNCPYYGRTADPNYLRQLDDELKMMDEWQAGFLQWAWAGYIKGYSVSLAMLTDDWSTLNEVGEQVWKVHLPLNTLIVTATIGGTTDPPPERYDYEEGTSAIVNAIPDAGYRFMHWELDGIVRTENPITIIMDRDYSLRAVFEALPPPPPEKCYLTIVAINGQTNPAAGAYEVNKGTSVTVTCTANSGYKFKEWLLDNVSVGASLTYIVLMDINHSLVAVCEEISAITHTLFVSAATGGTTLPAPGTYELAEGTSAIVSAIPDASYRFVHWELDETIRTENSIIIVMDKAHSLRAVFEYVPPPPTTADIQGTVTDKAGSPLAGATVTCNGFADITEADGSFQFLGIEPKSYTVTASKEGYVSQAFIVVLQAGTTVTLSFVLSTPPAPGVNLLPLALLAGLVLIVKR